MSCCYRVLSTFWWWIFVSRLIPNNLVFRSCRCLVQQGSGQPKPARCYPCLPSRKIHGHSNGLFQKVVKPRPISCNDYVINKKKRLYWWHVGLFSNSFTSLQSAAACKSSRTQVVPGKVKPTHYPSACHGSRHFEATGNQLGNHMPQTSKK